MAIQTTFTGEKKEVYYCIHCNYYGFEYDETEDGHELCPKCGWVCYSDSEVRRSFLHSNLYPKLKEKYKRHHRIKG